MTLRVVRDLEESAWSEFVLGHPDGNVFHSPEMFKVFQRTSGHDPELWAVTDGADVLALATPVRLTLFGGPLRAWTTRSVSYGGVLVAEGSRGPEALSTLLETYGLATGRRSLFTEFRNLHDVRGFEPIFRSAGYRYEAHLNYLVDLQAEPEEVLQRMGRRTRHHIRRAIRQGRVEVKEVVERDAFAAWYGTLRMTYEHARVPLADDALFRAAYEILRPLGMVKFYAAWIDGVAAASSAELVYNGTIYGWYGGTDRRFAAYTPTELLIWKVLEWGSRHGHRSYDFGGAGKPDEAYGVRDFKAKFGGRQVEFGRFTAVHSPARLAISQLGYAAYRRLRASRPDVRPTPLAKSDGT